MARGQLTSWLGRPEVIASWAGTAAVIAAVYVAVMALGELLAPGARPEMLPAIVATVVVAAVIGPVQHWCEGRFVRMLYGERTAPYDTLRQFASRLGEGRDPVELPQRMARLLAEGTGASWAQVWVQVGDQLQLIATHPTGAAATSEPPAVGAPGARDGMRWVSVGHHGAPLGVLRLQERPGHPLTSVEERLFAGLAAQAGLALHAAQLRAGLLARHGELSRRAVELRVARDRLVTTQDNERRRLERDIHDGAQQQLVALSVNLRLAQTLASRSSPRAPALLREQVAAATAAVDTVTSLSRGVLPRVLDEHGLVQAFRAVAQASPIPVVVTGNLHERLAPDIEANLYFCGLEAIQNAVKHSGAATVTISVDVATDAVCLTVADDGTGLRGGNGTGLGNIRQRLREVAGTLHVQSAPGAGTTVRAVVPVPVEATT